MLTHNLLIYVCTLLVLWRLTNLEIYVGLMPICPHHLVEINRTSAMRSVPVLSVCYNVVIVVSAGRFGLAQDGSAVIMVTNTDLQYCFLKCDSCACLFAWLSKYC